MEIREHDGRRIAALVDGRDGGFQVLIDLRSERIGDCTCGCPAFEASGTCEHVWAVLSVAFGSLSAVPEASEPSGSGLRTWLAGLQRLENSTGAPHPGPAPSEGVCRVDYVLMMDDSESGQSTVLETRRAKPTARGGFGKSSPFALLAPRKDEALGEEDRRIAAQLRGARSSVVTSLPRSKSESRYLLDADQTRALLGPLCATGRLHWGDKGQTSKLPLVLDTGPAWKPILTLGPSSEEGLLALTASLERDAERIPGRALRGILSGNYVVVDERILPSKLGQGRAWFLMTATNPPPPFPRRDAPALLLELARREIDVEPGPDMETFIEARRPVPHLTLSAPKLEGGKWQSVTGIVEFDYTVGRVPASDRRPLLPTGRGVLRRYFEVEDVMMAPILAQGIQTVSHGSIAIPTERVNDLVSELGSMGWIIEGEGAKWRTLTPPKVSLASGLDWFEIEGHFEGIPKGEFPKLLAALRRGESTVRLGDGSTGVVPEEWLARWRTAMLLGETKNGKLRFRSHQAWLVDLLLTEFVDEESARLWAAQKERLGEFESIKAIQEPAGFCGELRPYQREGLGWLDFLERHHFGGCLADDMGLGKTVQVLAWLQARKERTKRPLPSLIVAPKSLTHNWKEEASHFTPGLTTLEYVGTDRKRLRESFAQYDIILTTYGSVRLDIDFLREFQFGVVALDEAQAIKNESSRTARSVRLLRADQRLALSGTPIENHVGELWSLFEFLNPGMFGRSSAFQTVIAAPPTVDMDEDSRSLISRAVRPFLLRRTKEEVLSDLPERSEQTVLCDMEPAQRKEYVELREHFRRTLLAGKSDEELHRDKLGVLEMLLRLRQAACHPALMDAERADEDCAKFDAFFPMLDDVLESGHKALVFSQFTRFLGLLRRRLDASSIPYGYLDGKTSTANRAKEVERFQNDPERKLFLISLKAGGTGLNLTAADYVFLMDPWWNPAVEAQAIDRAHRIGQERNVFAYRMVCRDTVEERVLELQDRKRALASAILDADGSLVKDLTREDLEQLLS